MSADHPGDRPDAKVPGRTANAEVSPELVDVEETTCPRCGESQQLAKVKGCIKCLTCGYKFDCNGW